MHDPISFDPSWGLPSIENQSLFHPNLLGSPRGQHRLISPSGLPIPRCGRPVWPRAVRILPVPWTKEVPLLLPKRRLSCQTIREKEKKSQEKQKKNQ